MEAALPGYQVEGDLGKGGYGLVLAGQHRLIGRKVAIKILLDTSDDPELRARFLSEARVLAELDHPHIVRVHDYVEHEGTCLLVMELLSGGTLKQRIQGGKINQETICSVGIAAAAALSTAHAAGVLHRDVKPDNIMFDGSGLLKVTDFGIAKIFDGAETTASAILGTPRYMAPEQILGSRLFPSTDLYALGGVLYEMFAERPLFGRPMGVQPLTHHHLNVMPERLTNVPAPVSAVIMRALTKDPTARYGDATEFALELARAAVQAFGPNWLTRSDVKIRVDDEIREAAHGTSSTPNPPFGVPPAQPLRPPGPGTPPPGGPGYPGGFTPAQPLSGQPYGPRPGMPGGPGFQPMPGPPAPGQPVAGRSMPSQPVAPPVRPFAGGPTGSPTGWSGSAPGSTLGPTPPSAPLATPGYRQPPPGGWTGGGPTQQPQPPRQPPRQAPRQPPPQPRHQADKNGLFGLSARTTWIAGALVFVLIVGLIAAIALAASSGGGGGGGDQDDAASLYPDRTAALPASAVGFAGQGLRIPNMAPYKVAIADDGSLYVSSYGRDVIHKITKDGAVTTVAGIPSSSDNDGGFSGDGGPATEARLNGPGRVAVDAAGNIYVPDVNNFRVRKIDPTGKITTVVGNGEAGFSGDNGPAAQAQINGVESLTAAADGTLYLADYANERIRKVTPDGTITTIAGTGNAGYTSTPTPATSADLDGPSTVALAADGTLYVANLGSDTVQRITPDGVLHPFAGNGKRGRAGDGGPATDAALSIPVAALGQDGSVYIINYGSNTIRKVAPDGIITTIAGTGSEGNSGDGGPAAQAQFNAPEGFTIDASGAIYVADTGNDSLRRIDPNGTITTIARQS
ncbi:serine/threonine-protein kinase [Frankia nepalensis]|uniref:serine/threonine-protein kinase n=1 Tax=Frankia nepalensis TaxID=1836974 RepID=UPI0027DAE708|nr:serine/threonine-protein kinase [Frankia nepalensis]